MTDTPREPGFPGDRPTPPVLQTAPEPSPWQRGLFVLLYAALFQVAEVVMLAVVLFQFLSTVFAGGPNPRLAALGRQLAAYAAQVWRYLCYDTEQRPFPFADWPSTVEVSPPGSPR